MQKMESPVINDDWVAIKEFPLLVGKAPLNAEPQDGTEIDGQDNIMPAGQYAEGSATSRNIENNLFTVRWIEELNVIQVIYYFTEDCENVMDVDSLTQNEPSKLMSEFTVEKISSIHDQICIIYQTLIGLLPDLPVVPKGIWSFISSVHVPESFEENMVVYFNKARLALGEQLFLENFFQQETVTEEEYLENLSNLHRKAFADNVRDAELFLGEVLALRDGSINIYDMISLYSLEDEALEKLEIAKAMVYNFDRQPFLDLREIAHQQLKNGMKKLNIGDLPEIALTKLAEECLDWKMQLVDNEENLLGLQYQFFESSLRYLVECQDRMIDDEMRFGKENFQNTTAPARLVAKSKEVSDLSAQLLRTKKMMCIKERNRIRQDVVKLDESENLEDEIEKLEKKFFQKQIEIFDIDLKILEEEEQFIRLNLREYMTVDQQEEEDMFFEAFEEQPEDSEMIFDISPGKEDNNIDPEELKRKQEWVRKLNRIFRKRAWIRNKKRKCEAERKNKIRAKQAVEDSYKWHHSIQIKRDKNKEELERKKGFIQEMRKKTIERLKDFKKKYPDPVVKRPPRYLPPVRRTRSGRSSPAPNKLNNSIKQSLSTSPAVPRNGESKGKVTSLGKECKSSQKTLDQDSIDGIEESNTPAPCLPLSASAPPFLPPPAPPMPPLVPPPAPPPAPPPPLKPAEFQPRQREQKIRTPTNSDNRGGKISKSGNTGKEIGRSDVVDLNQVILARQNLRRRTVEEPSEKPSKSVNDDIMSLIRSGVKLKKVDRAERQKEPELSDIAASMLRNTLAKMNKHICDSSEDENENDDEFM